MTGTTRRVTALLAIAVVTSAYAGTRDTYFTGMAGPYPIRVVVHVPGVIPGLAQITVAVPKPEDIHQVSVQPVVWNLPPDRAPAPDIATPAQGGEFHAQLWLMVSGSYGVRVLVRGVQGDGITTVPVTAVAYQRLDMPLPLNILLLALTGFLALGLITIVRAAASESVLPPGQAPDQRDRRRGWIGFAAASAWAALVLVGGNAWRESADRRYRQRLYHPPELLASVTGDTTHVLRLEVRDTSWLRVRRQRPLVKDEGFAAHVFLVSDATFAHLHPLVVAPGTFETMLPALPQGRYQVFVEVVDSTGFTETLSSTTDLPAPRPVTSSRSADKGVDGFWFVESDQHTCLVVSEVNPCRRMADESTVTLRPDRGFAFSLRKVNELLDVDWTSTEAADVVLLNNSGELVHLRLHGTSPRAAIDHFGSYQKLRRQDPGEVDFPYPLITPESRRVWVQFRAGGKRMVAQFDFAAGGN